MEHTVELLIEEWDDIFLLECFIEVGTFIIDVMFRPADEVAEKVVVGCLCGMVHGLLWRNTCVDADAHERTEVIPDLVHVIEEQADETEREKIPVIGDSPADHHDNLREKRQVRVQGEQDLPHLRNDEDGGKEERENTKANRDFRDQGRLPDLTADSQVKFLAKQNLLQGFP